MILNVQLVNQHPQRILVLTMGSTIILFLVVRGSKIAEINLCNTVSTLIRLVCPTITFIIIYFKIISYTDAYILSYNVLHFRCACKLSVLCHCICICIYMFSYNVINHFSYFL